MGFFTVGHSNRSLDEFIDILEGAGIDLVIDVRAFPRSRENPSFNIDTLPDSLAAAGISYEHCRDLGGRRGRQPDVPKELNSFWRNESFHNYADYALSGPFRDALGEITGDGVSSDIALMCSEAAWWRCHRRIISDYLVLGGFEVQHLMAPNRSVAAVATPGAVFTSEGNVIYPAEPTGGTAATGDRDAGCC
ncbi:DUF488 domain-containing protein [Rhizobium sp. Root1220]|uniref:DUF488 domain-containing protein n=1 Tax=Rhizobium sp. Root1220 TaxID=1736432 RepID=UPI000A7B24F8|nr:DUF488 domain-containing protein [Rhizobium sp. Root1220]